MLNPKHDCPKCSTDHQRQRDLSIISHKSTSQGTYMHHYASCLGEGYKPMTKTTCIVLGDLYSVSCVVLEGAMAL